MVKKVESKDSFDIKKAKEILDEEHYGIEDIKDRILGIRNNY